MNEAGVYHDTDTPLATAGGDLSDDVAALQIAVLLADPRRIIEQAGVGLGIQHNRLGTGLRRGR